MGSTGWSVLGACASASLVPRQAVKLTPAFFPARAFPACRRPSRPWCAAQLLRRTGRVAESVPLYERALSLFEKTAGPAHRTTTTCVLALAAILEERGDVAGAAALYGRAADALRQAVAEEPKKSPALAAMLVRLGTPPRGSRATRLHGPPGTHCRERHAGCCAHPIVHCCQPARCRHPSFLLHAAGEAHTAAGRLADAEAALSEAVGICVLKWGAASPRTVQPRLLFAELLCKIGQADKARAEATAALGSSPAEGQRARLESVLAKCS